MENYAKHENTASAFIAREIAKGKKSNRLVSEKSPYLLQHAFNPVDWYAWGEEAFAAAKRQKKPIFLSIGYSTCHWCHVMEKESFEDLKIAALLNKYFISIKVDREERPDLDQVYMEVTQAMAGSGGWPMSVFLTPELKPFFAGTYFPPESRYGRPGFADLLESIHNAWQKDQDDIVKHANEVIAKLDKENKRLTKPGKVDDQTVKKAVSQFSYVYDEEAGGFGGAPKFPRPVTLNFLMRYGKRTKDKQVTSQVLVSLKKMAAGGVFDHVGGGFHRYSVDAQWRVPHFEKMLYDQAMLVPAYLEAYQISKDKFYKNVAEKTLDYVLREMRDPAGGFYSAEDADSPLPGNIDEQSEGAFYIWSEDEIRNIFDKETADFLVSWYGIEKKGNALEDPHGYFHGKNILFQKFSAADAMKHFGYSEEQINEMLNRALPKLLAVRNKRPHPLLDDKILSSWNGLLMSALSKGFLVSGNNTYLDGASQAAEFIHSKMYDKGTLLLHRFWDGEAGIEGYLDDYAFLVQGLLDLYEASFDVKWLAWAVELTHKKIALFYDQQSGGFFDHSGKDKSLLLRNKADYDGPEPAGSSIAALNMLRLGQMLDDEKLVSIGEKTILAFAGQLNKTPTAMPQLLSAYEFSRHKPTQIIVAGRRGAGDTLAMQQIIADVFLPHKVVLFASNEQIPASLSDQLEYLSLMTMLDDKATAYVCENFSCKKPTNDLGVLRDSLAK